MVTTSRPGRKHPAGAWTAKAKGRGSLRGPVLAACAAKDQIGSGMGEPSLNGPTTVVGGATPEQTGRPSGVSRSVR